MAATSFLVPDGAITYDPTNTIDDDLHLIEVAVDADELARRAEGWTEPPLPVSSGTLYKFAKLATDASHGCVTDA